MTTTVAVDDVTSGCWAEPLGPAEQEQSSREQGRRQRRKQANTQVTLYCEKN